MFCFSLYVGAFAIALSYNWMKHLKDLKLRIKKTLITLRDSSMEHYEAAWTIVNSIIIAYEIRYMALGFYTLKVISWLIFLGKLATC